MKKFWSFFLALLLLLFMGVGCGNKEKAAAPAASSSFKISQNATAFSHEETTTVQKAAKPPSSAREKTVSVKKGAAYTDKEHVAAYLHRFKKLPPNYIGKKEAQKLGWKTKGSLDKVAPGKSIGGDRYQLRAAAARQSRPHLEGMRHRLRARQPQRQTHRFFRRRPHLLYRRSL